MSEYAQTISMIERSKSLLSSNKKPTRADANKISLLAGIASEMNIPFVSGVLSVLYIMTLDNSPFGPVLQEFAKEALKELKNTVEEKKDILSRIEVEP